MFQTNARGFSSVPRLLPAAECQCSGQSHWVCGHFRAHQHAFKIASLAISVLLLDSSHFSPFSLFFFAVCVPLIFLNSTPSWLHNRRTQPCRLCPPCLKCVAFLTSMEASWWDPSLHCWATRSWWLGSSPTAPGSPRTGKRTRERSGMKREMSRASLCVSVKETNHPASVLTWIPSRSLLILLPSLLVLCQLWRGLL